MAESIEIKIAELGRKRSKKVVAWNRGRLTFDELMLAVYMQGMKDAIDAFNNSGKGKNEIDSKSFT